MSRKRLRTSSESNLKSLNAVFALEKAPKPVIKGSKRTTIDDEKIYLESEPPGKDRKDMILSNKMLTNLMCPVVNYNILSYGYNFGGGHKYQTANIHNGGGLDTIAAGPPLNPPQTDARRMVFQGGVDNQSDTIAWTAGTQAWYESISLPGTWTASNWAGETAVKEQPSVVGLINASKYGLTVARSTTDASDPNTTRDYDYMVCYRGGSQTHTFVNQNEHEIFYELWELTPRDIVYDWIEAVYDTSLNAFGSFDNIHTYITYGYTESGLAHSNASAESHVNRPGSYSTSLTSNNNPDGQNIMVKNDVGFRVNHRCLDLYHKFRVSQPQKGSIKSGGVLTYKMKHGPFMIKNSVWNRWVRARRIAGDLNPSDDSLADRLEESKYGHLIPCATKIMCIRFWSEIATKSYTGTTGETTDFKFNYADVSHAPGKVLHTVKENHSCRVVPYVKQNQYIEKNFRKIDYGASTADTNSWKIINDESNTQMTTLED